MTVDLYCPARNQHRKCRVTDIGLSGLFVVGLPCFKRDQEVVVTFGHAEDGALSLPCRVARVALDGAALRYDNPSPAQLEELREFIYPEWRGGDLLQGVLILANWVEADSFAGWLRLITLLEHWQRVTVSARREFASSRIPDPMVVPPPERLMN
jgi:hypothetical protein